MSKYAIRCLDVLFGFDSDFDDRFRHLIHMPTIYFNNRFLRERGHVQPQNGITGFSLHFPNKTQLWLPRKWENSFGKTGKNFCPFGCLSLVLLN